MNEININFSQGESVKANSQLQQKTEQLKKLLTSFKSLGESSKLAVNGDLFNDINKLTQSLDKMLQPNQNTNNTHQSFIEISQKTLEFFTNHEHEMLFEQFEELNDFAKKRKKKPSMQEFITASLQNVGIWTLNTNKIPVHRVQESNESNSSGMGQRGKNRAFDSIYEKCNKDENCVGSLNYVPADLIPRLPNNNLGEILAFSISKDISFESFHSTSSGGAILENPDISSQTPSMMATSMSVNEIYDAISALLNKVILTEDDIFKLLQLLSEGGLQLIGMMPQAEIQDIINTIDDSISDIAQKSSSIENIMALLAHIQQFSGTDLGQLANIPLIESQFSDDVSQESTPIQNAIPLTIKPLYDDTNSDTMPISETIQNEPDAIDEQVAGAQSAQKNSNSLSNSNFEESLSSDKIESIKDLGSTLLKFSESKQEIFADKMLEMLIHVMSKKLKLLLLELLL